MAKIKSFTSLEQSKRLAEILPIESADICYVCGNTILVSPTKYGDTSIEELYKKHIIPTWSLVALLGVLPNGIVINKDSKNGKYHVSSTHIGTYITADNPVDACVAVIEKLHELNLL